MAPEGSGYRVRMDSPHPKIRVRSVVFDCPDPVALAAFYRELLGGTAEVGDPDWCEVHPPGASIKLAFQRVENHHAPEWPDGTPQQAHLDLDVTDLEGESRRAVSLGARVLTGPVEEPGCSFIVHADPVGHPFCLCRER